MIKFSLICDKEHGFEAWFRSSADFDGQKKKKILTCPVCDSSKVEKSLMAPNVGVKSNRRSGATGVVPVSQPDTSSEGSGAPEAPDVSAIAEAATGLPQEVQEHVVKLAREIRKHVVKTADNVGDKFAEEARKIHYEEAKPRGIYGKATMEEAQDLAEEGIDVHALPVLPEDRN